MPQTTFQHKQCTYSFPNSEDVFGTPWINITQGPEDTYVTVGEVVPCYCIHNGTDDLPLWRINNILHSPSALPPGHMANKTGIFFQAFRVMNQSTYQCQFSVYSGVSKSFAVVSSAIGTVHVLDNTAGGNMSSADSPKEECNTTFVAAVIESPIIQLQWNPVNPSAPECPDNVTYCVSYRCCNDTNWKQTNCTPHTSIKFEVNLEGCEVKDQAVFSVQVEGTEVIKSLTVNLENNTELIVDKVGAGVQIQAQGCSCNPFGEFCIAPNGSNTDCYKEIIPPEINNYTLTVCTKRQCTDGIRRPCLQTNATETMNNTIYTAFCWGEHCNSESIPIVGATSKLIVAAPPSQPERPCLYYNGTHIVLCAELPFSHLLITVFNISLTTTCDEMYHDSIVATDLCEPIPVSDIVKMTDDCQLANVTITAQSDAGESQPSPPATVNNNETDFCSCVGQRLPQGNATYVYESGSPVQFEVQQPTNPLPPNLIINFCSGSLGITIMSASGQKKTISKMWNMVWCDFESGQAQINLSVDSFPRPTAERNYTVIFNISFHIDGFVDLCYLQVEVDNVTLADQGGVNIVLVVVLTVVTTLVLLSTSGCIIGILCRRKIRNSRSFTPIHIGDIPPQDGNTPPHDGNTPPHDGNTPSQDVEKTEGPSPTIQTENPTSQVLGEVVSEATNRQ